MRLKLGLTVILALALSTVLSGSISTEQLHQAERTGTENTSALVTNTAVLLGAGESVADEGGLAFENSFVLRRLLNGADRLMPEQREGNPGALAPVRDLIRLFAAIMAALLLTWAIVYYFTRSSLRNEPFGSKAAHSFLAVLIAFIMMYNYHHWDRIIWHGITLPMTEALMNADLIETLSSGDSWAWADQTGQTVIIDQGDGPEAVPVHQIPPADRLQHTSSRVRACVADFVQNPWADISASHATFHGGGTGGRDCIERNAALRFPFMELLVDRYGEEEVPTVLYTLETIAYNVPNSGGPSYGASYSTSNILGVNRSSEFSDPSASGEGRGGLHEAVVEYAVARNINLNATSAGDLVEIANLGDDENHFTAEDIQSGEFVRLSGLFAFIQHSIEQSLIDTMESIVQFIMTVTMWFVFLGIIFARLFLLLIAPAAFAWGVMPEKENYWKKWFQQHLRFCLIPITVAGAITVFYFVIQSLTRSHAIGSGFVGLGFRAASVVIFMVMLWKLKDILTNPSGDILDKAGDVAKAGRGAVLTIGKTAVAGAAVGAAGAGAAALGAGAAAGAAAGAGGKGLGAKIAGSSVGKSLRLGTAMNALSGAGSAVKNELTKTRIGPDSGSTLGSSSGAAEKALAARDKVYGGASRLAGGAYDKVMKPLAKASKNALMAEPTFDENGEMRRGGVKDWFKAQDFKGEPRHEMNWVKRTITDPAVVGAALYGKTRDLGPRKPEGEPDSDQTAAHTENRRAAEALRDAHEAAKSGGAYSSLGPTDLHRSAETRAEQELMALDDVPTTLEGAGDRHTLRRLLKSGLHIPIQNVNVTADGMQVELTPEAESEMSEEFNRSAKFRKTVLQEASRAGIEIDEDDIDWNEIIAHSPVMANFAAVAGIRYEQREKDLHKLNEARAQAGIPKDSLLEQASRNVGRDFVIGGPGDSEAEIGRRLDQYAQVVQAHAWARSGQSDVSGASNASVVDLMKDNMQMTQKLIAEMNQKLPGANEIDGLDTLSDKQINEMSLRFEEASRDLERTFRKYAESTPAIVKDGRTFGPDPRAFKAAFGDLSKLDKVEDYRAETGSMLDQALSQHNNDVKKAMNTALKTAKAEVEAEFSKKGRAPSGKRFDAEVNRRIFTRT